MLPSRKQRAGASAGLAMTTSKYGLRMARAGGPRSPFVGWLIAKAERALDAGAHIIMIESEGITENVSAWRIDVVARIINQLGLEKVMFEGADPPVFEWYVKNSGNEVNLFVDHSQIVQLEALRSGIWGTKSTWGRIQNLAR
jgi:phosphosulfolactate synthase (CoM biosynthesis protein A)